MTMLFCIREEGGKPVAAKLMRRRLANLRSITAEVDRLMATGKWTRIEQLCAWIPLMIQFAQWALSLLPVNPRYVLDPRSLVAYVRGPNWNDPDPTYAHFETSVKGFGDELWHEFASYRGVSVDEAVRRYSWLLCSVHLKPVEEI